METSSLTASEYKEKCLHQTWRVRREEHHWYKFKTFIKINGYKVVVLIEGLRQMYFADDKTSLSVSPSEKCSSR